MVKLRLKRMGRKFGAFYRIVAADARAPRDGKFIEEIGFYNPHNKITSINKDLLNKWLKDGAKPTETVKTLIRKFDSSDAKVMKTVDGVQYKEIKPKKKKAKLSVPVEMAKEEILSDSIENVDEIENTQESGDAK